KSATDCARAHRCNFPSPVSRGCPPGHQSYNAACAPKRAINKLRTRLAIAQACLRSSTFLARRFRRPLSFTPAICTVAGPPDLIEHAPNHCVDNGGDGTGSTVEGGNRGKNNCASLKQRHDVARMDQIPRCFPGNEN